MDCIGRHRQYGVNVSFAKSLTLDTWSKRLIYFMENGGNHKFIDYLTKNGGNIDKIDYSSYLVKKYKTELLNKVNKNLKLLILSLKNYNKVDNLFQKDNSIDINSSNENAKNKEKEIVENINEKKEKIVVNNLESNEISTQNFDVNFKKRCVIFKKFFYLRE